MIGRKKLRISAIACLQIGVFLVCGTSIAQEKPNLLDPAVAATVEGEPVLVREVQREFDRALKNRKLDPQGEKFLRAQTLEQLIGRKLVLQYLAGKKAAATKADIDLQFEKIKRQLKQQNLTLAEFLARGKLDEPEFRRTLAWQLSWQRYLDDQLSDEILQKYFDKHRRDFDGSQVRAAHILFKVEPAGSAAGRERALQKAAEVREAIATGKLSFAKAAELNSAAPTAAAGGEIGFIARHEPMPEPFSKAAFSLEPGSVSRPVESPVGVHLITCLAIKPGQGTWQDARGELEAAVTRYLFDWIVAQERADAKIEYTGAAPHFKPGTEEVAE